MASVRRYWPLILAALFASGCKPPTPIADSEAPVSPAPSVRPMTQAMAFTLTTTLAQPQAASFARLEPAEKRALELLLARSTQRTRVFAAGGRLLILPPENHPASGLALLFDGAKNLLDVRLPEGHIVRLPGEALVDVLDRALPSQRALGEDPMHGALPQLQVESLPSHPMLKERWRVDAPLSYQRRDLGALWSLRLGVTLETFPSVTFNDPRISPLCPLVFPLLLGLDHTLVGLRLCPPEVLGWRISLDNSDRESAAPARFETRIEAEGWQTISEHLERFRGRAQTAWRLPGPDKSGSQTLPPATLRPLRPSGPRGALTVDNRSGVAAMIYLDGALLGWVASGRQISFEGIPRGFFRVFATAPSGVRAWGPKELYLPGTLTLD